MNEGSTDILMVFPSGGDLNLSNFQYNLGSAYIIAYLSKNGFKAKQFISNESSNVGECVKQIVDNNPKIVGFTVYEKNYMQCVLISQGLKTLSSKIIVIFGGPTATVQSKEILESVRSIDICVRGEGEETMLKLLSALFNNKFDLKQTDLFNIKGISFKKGNEIIINPDSNILLSNRSIKYYLDKYPSPYLSDVIPASAAFPTGIITARGCNQNCVYCNCAIVNKRNIYFHSVERVIAELSYLNEQWKSLAPILINDDTFTVNPSRVKKICESIIESDIKLPLSCITRCDKITEELLDLMKQAGFISVGFSLESAVPRVLRAIGKVNPPQSVEKYDRENQFIDKLKNMTSYAKKIGMYPVYASIMVGLPGESIQDAQETLRVIKELDLDFYSHNYFHIYRGTPIYDNYEKYGYRVKPIGQKNKIFLHNNFPFDINKIKLAPNSATEKNSKIIDYDNLKIISLSTKRKLRKPFFDNAIINSDNLSPSLVSWIQENLAINGAIIQIYSNKLKYRTLHKENETTLYDAYSPTMYYQSYYRENNILKSGRMVSLGEQIGLFIKIVGVKTALEDYQKDGVNMDTIICSEQTTDDTDALLNLLNNVSETGNSFKYLLTSKVVPEFQGLCRWTRNEANCQKLETAIIDGDGSIRICWYSNPIGDINTPNLELIENLQDLQKREMERRNCKNCIKKETCIKCIFPSPLSSQDYCEYKRVNETIKPARLINSFYVLKDFLYKPINPFGL